MRILMLFLILQFPFMSLASTKSNEEREIVLFFIPVERLRLEMESALPALTAQRPDLADEFSQMPSRFDANEVASRTATVLEGRLSEKEILLTLEFIKSPAGRAMYKLQRESDPQKRKIIERRVNPDIFRQILAFAASPLGQKIVALLNSTDAARIQSGYGREIMCGAIKESKPAAFQQFRDQGACVQL